MKPEICKDCEMSVFCVDSLGNYKTCQLVDEKIGGGMTATQAVLEVARIGDKK